MTKNSKDIKLTSGQAIDLPVRTWYRIQNSGSENMVFIEIKTGHYFKENDIESLKGRLWQGLMNQS